MYHDDEQKMIAEKVIESLALRFSQSIVTEVSAFGVFYEAEEDHQNYYKNNSSQPYCSVVISPKIKKLREMYAEKLK